MRVFDCLALALLACACGNRTVTIEPTSDLLGSTQEAVALWRPTLDSCGLELRISSDAEIAIMYGETGVKYGLNVPDAADPQRGRVLLKESVLSSDHELLVRVIAHELGHVLGAVHSPNPVDLMYSDVSRDAVPTARDAALVCD